MKRVLQRIASSLFVVLMGIGEAHAGFLPPIDLGEGRALKFFYEAQFGLTYRNMGSGVTGDRDTTDFNFRRNRLVLLGKPCHGLDSMSRRSISKTVSSDLFM